MAIYIAYWPGNWDNAIPEVEVSLNPEVPSPRIRLADSAEVEVLSYKWPEQFGGDNLLPKLHCVQKRQGSWGQIRWQFSYDWVRGSRKVLGLEHNDFSSAEQALRDGGTRNLNIGYLEIRVLKHCWYCPYSPDVIINYVKGITKRRNRQIHDLKAKLTALENELGKKSAEA